MILNYFWFEKAAFIPWIPLTILFSILHIVVIAPILFKSWIIPKISKRYNVVFDINYPPPFPPSSKWAVPSLEISTYIVFKCIGCGKFIPYGLDKPQIGIRPILQKINYNIETASQAEIILSFITFFCMVCCLFAAIFIGFPLLIRKSLG